jgi:hypothetical protein
MIYSNYPPKNIHYRKNREYLSFEEITETTDSTADSSGSGSRDGPSTTGHSLITSLAGPDTNGTSLDGVFTTESTSVSGVLGDFHLLYLLTEGSTITGTVFTDNSDLFGTFGHFVL